MGEIDNARLERLMTYYQVLKDVLDRPYATGETTAEIQRVLKAIQEILFPKE